MIEDAPTLFQSIGQTYQDYLVTNFTPLEEIQSSLVELVHVPSGAKIIHIANEDPENLFCLSFQTLPYSSNGIAHILEHTVLCGSDKFPVKDPFFSMTRRSLNTYMNALTGQDFTCYPAASQVEKDFYNLLEIYTDAVFFPKLKEMSFRQEGHRLELIDAKDIMSKLQFQGVVYNEMKGAMSSIDSRGWEILAKHLLPDLPYAFNSGGNPKEIPDLSYEELLEFHKEFYHPSRCLFFFYGNLPLSKHLDHISPILEKTEKLSPLPLLPKQTRFEEPVIATGSYPVEKSASLEKRSFIYFSWLTASISDQNDLLGLQLLESLLTDTDASPLAKKLLESGLIAQVESSLDIEMSEVPWIITCKGCKEKDAEKIQKLLFDTLKEIRFIQEEIDASIHQLQFDRMEIGSEGAPFGLTLFFRSVLMKQHGCDPTQGLLIHTLFQNLREELKDPNYLPNLLNKYLIQNPHFVRLTLNPDPELSTKEALEEKKRLEMVESRLDVEQRKAIQEQMEKLKIYQEETERQSLDCLPQIHIRDVPKNGKDFALFQHDKIIYHPCFTNKILYLDLIFDLPSFTLEELPLLSLLTHFLPELGAGEMNYVDMLNYQQAHIGEFDASLSLITNCQDPNQVTPIFSLRAKALEENAPHLFALFQKYCEKVDLEDVSRLKELILQHATELREKMARSPMSYAISESLKSSSISSFYQNQCHGLSYYRQVMKWAKQKPQNLVEPLKAIAFKLFSQSKGQLVCSGDQKLITSLKNPFSFEKSASEPFDITSSLPKKENRAYQIVTPVAFSSLGMPSIPYGHPSAPYLWIATELMENLILHKEIREKGGAYGSGANYSPASATLCFYTYRDPQLSKSIEAFHLALKEIEDGKFHEQDLEEAKLGALQTIDAPISCGNRAHIAYLWQRQGKTKSVRESFRTKILSATKEQVILAVKEYISFEKSAFSSFIGKELFEKEKKLLKIPLSLEKI